MTTSTDMIRGRSNVVTLTNNSGGALVAGDVCIQDTSADEKVTTTTSAASVLKVFVAAEAIASGAAGRFYESGYCPLVNVNASVTRGRFLFTHTVAKQAAENATYGTGAFGKILKSGTTPSAIIYSQTAQVGSGVTRSGSTTDLHLAVWNGSNADSLKDGGAAGGAVPFPATTAPVLGDYTWVNQGGASTNALSYGIELIAPAGAGNNVRLLKKAAPGGSYTISVGFLSYTWNVNYAFCGIGWRQSSDGKLVLVGPGYGSANLVRILKYTDASTFSAAYTDLPYGIDVFHFRYWFLRLKDDGATNRTIWSSPDGRNWVQIHTVGRTDFLTANEVFFFAESNNASNSAGITVFSWVEA